MSQEKKNFIYVIYTDADSSHECEVGRVYTNRKDAEQYLLDRNWHLNEEYGWYENPDVDWCVKCIVKRKVY